MSFVVVEINLQYVYLDQNLTRQNINLGNILFDALDECGEVFDDDNFAGPAVVLCVAEHYFRSA